MQEHHEESPDWLGGAWKESIRGQSRVKDGDSVFREVGHQTAVIVSVGAALVRSDDPLALARESE